MTIVPSPEAPAHRSQEDAPGSVDIVGDASTSDSNDDNDDISEGSQSLLEMPKPTPFGLYSCTRSALDVKRSAYRIDSWFAVALTLDGRDKITKFLQYAARLVAWYFTGTRQQARFAALKSSLANSRKAFRLGRSLIEVHRLRLMGVLPVFLLTDELSSLRAGRAKWRQRLPSNTGFPHLPEEDGVGPSGRETSTSWRGRLSRSAFVLSASPSHRTMESIGLAAERIMKEVKLLGLAGFWAFDNMSFLWASEFFDNYQLESSVRSSRRKSAQSRTSVLANQSYFMGCVAGLWISVKALIVFRREAGPRFLDQSPDGRAKLQAKYFGLCLNLFKNVCDVLVFSNNAGIDLWKNQLGFKMNEMVHCVAGLASASVAVYKNFPEASSSKE
jgi:hypothetical protein